MAHLKEWFGLIRHRVYFLVGLGVMVTLLAGSVSYFVFNTLDVVTLIARLERSHTVDVFRASSSLHQYVNTEDEADYGEFEERLGRALAYSELFAATPELLETESTSAFARQLQQTFREIRDADQARGFALRLEILESNPIAQRLIALSAEVSGVSEQILAVAAELRNTTDPSRRQQLIEELDVREREVNELAHQFSDLTGELSQFAISLAVTVLVLVLILGMLVLGIVAWLLLRPMNRSVAQAVETIQNLADGYLDSRQYTAPGEMGQILAATNRLQQQLSRVVSDSHSISQTLASSAEELSTTTDALLQGAEEQSQGVKVVSGSVQQMSESEATVAGKARETRDVSMQTETLAREGGESVTRAVAGMNRMQQAVSQSSTTTEALTRASARVHEVVDTIQAIAEQTNLLALNAAIEAARAGEHGRGFSVVADEVRALSTRTQEATQDAAKALDTIETQVSQATTSMELCQSEVQAALDVTNELERAFQGIMASSSEGRSHNEHIAGALQENATRAEQILEQVSGISRITSNTEQSSQQINTAADQLARTAAELKDLLEWFKASGRSKR
ncbi:Methyl-accepting chemotaxis protein [Marinobacter daqiaonensis]|uniref:Methyl-accepting chemotaxis protein n=1 Tax=Marinobacter daqiaonensis TaxID=650891 RepID=A0A1I6GJ10_9GAMM|nr:methyl-accepting chemotaxis protein [Marinobacter daqiaonensis]SFR42166.1 Methyl-accepting chemotaxis protein [Marinobacter daqiaonensis]